MGIVNVTPDSFYPSSRAVDTTDVERIVREMVVAGVDMIDIGACSTRPGSVAPTVDEELARLRPALSVVRRIAAGIPISVDTWRSHVARVAVRELGADIINDISGGMLDSDMLPTVAALRVPYILMHMRGTPATMMSMTDYGENGVVAEVLEWLTRRVDIAHQAGIADVIADPGFGFAKTVDQNYLMMSSLGDMVQCLDVPVLAGVSRKSMVTAVTGGASQDALSGTTALNTLAMAAGVHIVRVHDVAAARDARDVVCKLRSLYTLD